MSGDSLIALLCAAALAPVLAAGTAPLAVMAAVGLVGSVGANVLTDVVTQAVDRLRQNGEADLESSLQEEIRTLLEEALGTGSPASELREATAQLLRRTGAVTALIEDLKESNQQLLPVVVDGFVGLGEQFEEFAFAADDMRQALREIEESLREQRAEFRVEQERARQDSLTLLAGLQAMRRADMPLSADQPGAMDPLWHGCPYVGLAPFSERDTRIFYGRDELVRQLMLRLWERLDDGGILVMVGASGAGKSSLLRAGLMPQLAAGALAPGSGTWPRRMMRPGSRPLRELARCLASMAAVEPISAYRSLRDVSDEIPDAASLLMEQAVQTVVAQRQTMAADGHDPAYPPRLVLVVDQFEDVFMLGEDSAADRKEQEAFVAALQAMAAATARNSSVSAALVVIAVRGDYLERALAFGPVAAAVDRSPFVVGAMSSTELRQVITGPAAEAGLTVEPGLVEAVLTELADGWGDKGAGALPLVSQAMAVTWEQRDRNVLSLRAYRRAGGVGDAVNRSAQETYTALTSRQQEAARLLFTRLTVVTPDGRLARVRCSRAELAGPGRQAKADANAVIEAFSRRRLLVLSGRGAEISHDVLLDSWKQLREWLGEDQASRALYSQLQADAQVWDASRRDSSYLYRQTRLAAVEAARTEWAAVPGRYPLTPASTAFLDAAHKASRRAVRMRSVTTAALLVLTLIAGITAGIAAHNAATADQNAASAALQHTIALSRQLAADSLSIDSLDDPVTARQLAVAAWAVYPTSQAGAAMTRLLAEQQSSGILPTVPIYDSGAVQGLAISPGGKVLASADHDGTVRLWNPATGQLLRTMRISSNQGPVGVDDVAFSPTGAILASATDDGIVQLWNPATGHPAATLFAPDIQSAPTVMFNLTGVAFSPDGRLLATADSSGVIRLWNLARQQPALTIAADAEAGVGTSSDDGVKRIAFSPNGTLLASADGDGTVKLWDTATGRLIRTLHADTGPLGVFAVAFSPSSGLLASGDSDGTIRLWNTATGKLVLTLDASAAADYIYGNGVYQVAFSPDGKYLATADLFGRVRLWNMATKQPPLTLEADKQVLGAVAFSPDTQLLASTNGDGAIRLWNPATGQPAGESLHDNGMGDMYGMAFSPTGQVLASADLDGTVRLWNTSDGQIVRTLNVTNPAGGVASVAFSPNGRVLATMDNLNDSQDAFIGDGDGSVRLWDPSTGQLIHTLNVRHMQAMAFSPDGRTLATIGENSSVQLWNLASGTLTGTLPATKNLDSGVSQVAFSPNGKLLATADANGTIQLWDTSVSQPSRALRAADGVNAVAFSPDGKILASAGGGTIQLWDPATGQLVRTINTTSTDSSNFVNGIAFDPDGNVMATAYADGTIQFWDPGTGRAIGVPFGLNTTAGSGSTSIQFSPNGMLIATGDTTGPAQLWVSTPFEHPYASLCAETGPPTRATWTTYAGGEKEPHVCPLTNPDL